MDLISQHHITGNGFRESESDDGNLMAFHASMFLFTNFES